jgi:integral membrane protein (TIGR01906 family)
MMIRYVLLVVHRVSAIFAVLALFFILLGFTVSFLFIFKPLYTIGFERHGVSETTGITSSALVEVADAFVAYFISDDEYIAVFVDVYGTSRSLLNEKETIHMRDVKDLVNSLRNLAVMSSIGLLGYVMVLTFRVRASSVSVLARKLRRSAFAIIVAVIVFGLLVAVAFPAMFTLFHLISFSNDYWLLDPRQDYLVMLFTPNFFLEATGLLIGLIFLECSVLIGGSYILGMKRGSKNE